VRRRTVEAHLKRSVSTCGQRQARGLVYEKECAYLPKERLRRRDPLLKREVVVLREEAREWCEVLTSWWTGEFMGSPWARPKCAWHQAGVGPGPQPFTLISPHVLCHSLSIVPFLP
jgi:hypothetical protein